jgi:glycosyltransferase involved in cell wall biosynthesis
MHKYKKSKFLILIPAYNELKNLKKFVKKANKLAPVCVLDDGSQDDTYEWLNKNKICVKRNNFNLGYENNLLNGIKRYRKYCDYVITFDGDGQHKISDLKKILNFKNLPDIIICNRTIKNRFMEIVISYVFNFFFGFKDPLSGFKVYNSKILKKQNFENIGDFFLIDFLLSLLKNKIINLEITTKKREGDSRVGKLLTVGFKEIKILLKIISKKLI